MSYTSTSVAVDTAILWLYFYIITSVIVGSCLLGLGVFLLVMLCRKKNKDRRGRLIDSDDEDDERAERELDEYNKSIREGIEMSDIEKSSKKKKKTTKAKQNTSRQLGSRIIGADTELGATQQREGFFFESQKREQLGGRSVLPPRPEGRSDIGKSTNRSQRRARQDMSPIAPVTDSTLIDPMAPGSSYGFSRQMSSEADQSGVSIVDGRRVRKVKKIIKKVVKKKPKADE